jgi:ATP-dependent DNA helicase PIF1
MHMAPGPLDDVFDKIVDSPPEDREVPCARLIGVAGTGKSYTLLKRVQDDPHDLQLCATTGIASVNLGTITLNSLLSFFDTHSMRDAFLTGQLARKLHDIAKEYRWLAVEEYSMLHAEQLDLLYRAVQEANRYADVTNPLGILLVGDLAQLPPVRGRWCFEADSWDRFAANTTRLDKVWRQDTGPFLAALNMVRAGHGHSAAEVLTTAGAQWHTAIDTEYDGTTILPKNAMVSRYNAIALDRLPGDKFTVTSRRWGVQRPEWGENTRTHEWGIPPKLDLKVGAYVMILSNAKDFSVVNGDCGHVLGRGGTQDIIVRLVRTGAEMEIGQIVRNVDTPDAPPDFNGPRISPDDYESEWLQRIHYRKDKRRYVVGQVEYLPVRMANASTVHKSQSLTLDRVQVDYRDHFFGSPAMLYVALSRCRTLDGLRMVGSADKFAKQCKTDIRVLPWL